MTCQTLDWKEVLSIRWAHDDPNPVAQNAISMADKDALTAFLDARGVSTEVSNFNGPLDYHVPDPKRAKLTGPDSLGEYPELAYPDTDGQYATAHSTSLPGGQEPGPTPGIYSQDGAADMARVTGSSTDVLHATQTAVQGDSGSFCAGDYSSLFSALSTPQGTLSSSSAHNGQIVKDGSESQVDDLLNKKRLLMSLGLGSYLEDNAIETAVVPPGLATTEIIAAPPVAVAVIVGDEQPGLSETSRSEMEKTEDSEEDDDDDDEEEEEEEAVDGWTTHVDPDTGATYYHNRSTGESSWGSAPAS